MATDWSQFEVVDSPAVDLSQFEIVEAQPEREEASWAGAIGSKLKGVPAQFLRTFGSIGQMFGETHPLPETSRYFSQVGSNILDYSNDILGRLEEENYVEPGTLKAYVSNAIGMGAEFAPVLASGPVGGMSYIGAKTLGDRYQDAKETHGLDPVPALAEAAPLAVLDTAVSFPGVKMLQAAGPLVQKTLGPVLAFQGANLASGVGTYLADKAVLGESRYTPEEMARTLKESAIQNTVTPMIMGAGSWGAHRGARALKQRGIERSLPERIGTEGMAVEAPPADPREPVADIAPVGAEAPPADSLAPEQPRVDAPASDAPPALEPVSAPLDIQDAVRDVEISDPRSRLDDETGSIKIPFAATRLGERIRDTFARVKPANDLEALNRDFDEMAKDFIGPIGPKMKGAERTPSTFFYEGRIGDKKIPGLDLAMKAFRDNIYRPLARAEQFPEAMPARDTMWEKERQGHAALMDLYDAGKDYFDLVDRDRVNTVLNKVMQEAIEAEKRGVPFDVTDENLGTAKLSPEEIKAVRAAWNMSNATWGMLHKSALNSKTLEDFADSKNPAAALIDWRKTVDDYFEQSKSPYYVPARMRSGDLYVYAENPAGERWYSFHKTIADRNRVAANLRKSGYEVKRSDEFIPDSEAGIDQLPRDVRIGLKSILEGKVNTKEGEFPVQGFKAHLLRAENVKGFNPEELSENFVKYIEGAARYATRLEYTPKIRDALNMIDKAKNPQLYDDFAATAKYMDSNAPELQGLKSFLAHRYLGFLNPNFAVVNGIFQPMITHTPELGKILKGTGRIAEVELLRAARMSLKYQRNPEAFAKANKELFDALKFAERRGVIASGAPQELANISKGIPSKQKTWSEISMALATATERNNRIMGYIEAYNNAPKNLDEAGRRDFAEKFTRKVNFGYSKIDRPPLMRGKKSAMFLFKQYMLESLGMLKDNVSAGEWKAVSRQLGYTTALGGLKALPFAGSFINALTAAGGSPEEDVRKALGGDLGRTLLYGVPAKFGVNISGSVSIGDLSQNFEEGPLAAAFRTIGGVPVAAGQEVARAVESQYRTGDPIRTIENLAPRTIKNAMQAERWNREGQVSSIRGDTILKDPTMGEKALKAFSFNPGRLSDAYSESNATRRNSEREGDYNVRIARALAFGDRMRAVSLMKESQAAGIPLNSQAIKREIIAMKSPKYRAWIRTPEDKRDELADIWQTYEE